MNRKTTPSAALALAIAVGAPSAMAQPATLGIVPAAANKAATQVRSEGQGASAAPVIAPPGGGGPDSATCWVNCDNSVAPPWPLCINILDFNCFINQYAAASLLGTALQIPHYANCDESTSPPVLNIMDYACFLNKFAAGCTGC